MRRKVGPAKDGEEGVEGKVEGGKEGMSHFAPQSLLTITALIRHD